MTTTEFEIKTLFKPVFKLLLNSYGASKTFPLSLRHASTQFFGLDIDDPVFMQGGDKLRFFMGHMNIDDRVDKLLEVTHSKLELIIGKGKSPLEFTKIANSKYVPHTWLGSLCRFLVTMKGSVKIKENRVVMKKTRK